MYKSKVEPRRVALLLVLRTRNKDGNKLVIFFGIASYNGDNYIIPSYIKPTYIKKNLIILDIPYTCHEPLRYTYINKEFNHLRYTLHLP